MGKPDRQSGVSFRIDGLYLVEALRLLGEAKTLDDLFSQQASEISDFNKRIDEIEQKYQEKAEAYDEVELLCIQLDGVWSLWSDVCTRFLPMCASIHILCACCLEAHINLTGEDMLSGKSFDEFDKVSTLKNGCVPDFIEKLGLRHSFCVASTKAVETAIDALRKSSGSKTPSFMSDDWWSALRQN